MADNDFQYVNMPSIPEKEMKSKLGDIQKSILPKMEKWANKIQVSMAFTPQIDRVDGEIWEENGKKWIKKNGARVSYSSHQEARMPWWCPKCSKSMSGPNEKRHRKFYYLRGWCFDCNIDWEGDMRLNGTWDAFEKRMLRENEKSFLRDKIEENMTYIKEFRVPQMHFGDGRWESIGTIETYRPKFEQMEKDIEFMVARLEEIRKEEEDEATVTSNLEQPSS
jgi:hypothetical protein